MDWYLCSEEAIILYHKKFSYVQTYFYATASLQKYQIHIWKQFPGLKYKNTTCQNKNNKKNTTNHIKYNLREIPNLEVADNQHGISSVRPSAFLHHREVEQLCQIRYIFFKPQNKHTQSLRDRTTKRQKSKLRLGRHQIISGVFNLHCINSVCRIRNFNIICQPFYHYSKVHYRTKQSKTKHKTKIKVKWRQISGVWCHHSFSVYQ